MLVNVEAILNYISCLIIHTDMQAHKDKGGKSKPKAQPKAHTKKSARRRSPAKNDSNNGLLDTEHKSEHHQEAGLSLALKSEVVGMSGESPLAGRSSPAPRVFQMALSPADVLHVHSYAKGDYGEDEVPVREKDEGMNYSTDTEADSQDKGVSDNAVHILLCVLDTR